MRVLGIQEARHQKDSRIPPLERREAGALYSVEYYCISIDCSHNNRYSILTS